MHPNFPGLPWWGAVLLAVTATVIGFAIDAGSGNKELGFAFAACYAIGCVLAVLAVQQAGLFTAVIQPPLILFVSVPTAYFLFHNGQLDGLKDLLINCGYPLIERFPLMFFTSAVVLLIGIGRWYLGTSTRRTPATSAAAGTGIVAVASAKIAALVKRPAKNDPAKNDAEQVKARRRHSSDRPARKARPASGDPDRAARRPAKRAAPSRARHSRPPETETVEPVTDRPRRTRNPRRAEPPLPPSTEPRRRSRSQPPPDRYSGYDRPERRRRYEDRYEDRYSEPYDDYPPPEPRGPRTTGRPTHHPISRVRYRSSGDDDPREQT